MHWCHEVAQVTEVLLSSEEDLTVEDLAAYAHASNNVDFVHYPPKSKAEGHPKQLRRKGSKGTSQASENLELLQMYEPQHYYMFGQEKF